MGKLAKNETSVGQQKRVNPTFTQRGAGDVSFANLGRLFRSVPAGQDGPPPDPRSSVAQSKNRVRATIDTRNAGVVLRGFIFLSWNIAIFLSRKSFSEYDTMPDRFGGGLRGGDTRRLSL